MEEGLSATYGYNERGRLLTERNAAGETRHYDYNIAGDLVKINQPDGSAITQHYDKQENLTAKQYGKLSQQFHYDDAGRIHILVNENSTMTLFEYDVMDRLITKTSFDGHTKHYHYNMLNQLIKVKDVQLTSHYHYDLSGDLVESEMTETGKMVDQEYWQYNESGQLTVVSSQSGDYRVTISFERDKTGRVLQAGMLRILSASKSAVSG